MGKKIHLNYGSLNANSLAKIQSPQTQSSYIRFLRLQNFDILALQETHATDTTTASIEMLLQAHQAFWTPHCGIVSFSN
jgi:exonuclease III